MLVLLAEQALLLSRLAAPCTFVLRNVYLSSLKCWGVVVVFVLLYVGNFLLSELKYFCLTLFLKWFLIRSVLISSSYMGKVFSLAFTQDFSLFLRSYRWNYILA